MNEPYDFIDHERLIADVREGDDRAVEYAYRKVFGGVLGRLVLTHQLAMAGVGTLKGPSLTEGESRYHDGRADHALSILNQAGFDNVSAAHAVAADILEGQDHGRLDEHSGHSGFSGPDEHPVPD